MKAGKYIINEKGASAIELALIMPIILPILFGIVEYGWLFKKQMDLNNAVSEGVRAVVAENGDINNARAAMLEVMSVKTEVPTTYLVIWLNTFTTLNILEAPDRAELKVDDWPHTSLTGFFPSALLPSTLSSTAVMAFP